MLVSVKENDEGPSSFRKCLKHGCFKHSFLLHEKPRDLTRSHGFREGFAVRTACVLWNSLTRNAQTQLRPGIMQQMFSPDGN